MAKRNFLDVILNTINDVQAKNQASTKEPTADPNVFDLIRDKVQQLDQKNREKRVSRGKNPTSILDMIRKEVEKVRRQNKKDPDVETAPKSVFDRIIKKVEDKPKRQASSGIKRIVEEYNLPIDILSPELLQEIQERYQSDLKNMDHQYAKAIHDLIKEAHKQSKRK